jgi:methylated-DNA-[protein]-cysteine S-methyltransferase
MPTTAARLAEGYMDTWAGRIKVVAAPAGVQQVWLPDWRARAETPPMRGSPQIEPAALVEWHGGGEAERHVHAALRELAEYFAGRRRVFSVPLDPQGTDFFRRVWAEVARVPYGETRSYAEIARAVGAPRAVRAVGAANGANPVAPLVPCHRVVGSDGRLTGYGSGLPLKERLLIMEGALPASQEDYPDWIGRVAVRMDGPVWYVGVRGAGTFCRPGCAHAMRPPYRPGRFFRTAAEAGAAGFRPCPACQPDAVSKEREGRRTAE